MGSRPGLGPTTSWPDSADRDGRPIIGVLGGYFTRVLSQIGISGYHGGVDFGVNPAAMFRLVQALMDANKDFDLLIYPRAGHQTPGYGLRRNWDYFVRYLLGGEPPVEFKVTSDAEYQQEER